MNLCIIDNLIVKCGSMLILFMTNCSQIQKPSICLVIMMVYWPWFQIIPGNRNGNNFPYKMNTIRDLLEKYPTLFFCKNLVDFNETRLHESTLNLHTHA
jgi:hypothetical protein